MYICLHTKMKTSMLPVVFPLCPWVCIIPFSWLFLVLCSYLPSPPAVCGWWAVSMFSLHLDLPAFSHHQSGSPWFKVASGVPLLFCISRMASGTFFNYLQGSDLISYCFCQVLKVAWYFWFIHIYTVLLAVATGTFFICSTVSLGDNHESPKGTPMMTDELVLLCVVSSHAKMTKASCWRFSTNHFSRFECCFDDCWCLFFEQKRWAFRSKLMVEFD